MSVINFDSVKALFKVNMKAQPETTHIMRVFNFMHTGLSMNSFSTSSIVQMFEKIASLNIDYVVPYIAISYSKSSLYCIMDTSNFTKNSLEALIDGDLKDEVMLRNSIKGVFTALKTLHKSGIIHGAISPHKLLLDNEKEFCLYDFIGSEISARVLPSSNFEFIPPEIIKGESSSIKTDIWELGATLQFLAGDNMSSQLADLIKIMKCNEPINRITIENALKHQWFTCQNNLLLNNISVKEHIKHKYKMENIMMEIINRIHGKISSKEIKELRNTISSNDKSATGEIGYNEFMQFIIDDRNGAANFENITINYTVILSACMNLLKFCEQEIIGEIFKQLSYGSDVIQLIDLRDWMKNIGCIYAENSFDFTTFVRTVTNNSNEDLSISVTDFFAICKHIEFEASEDLLEIGFNSNYI